MKLNALAALAAAGTLALGISGCGGQNRSALARHTVQTYWNDLGHLQIGKAYALLSPGLQGTISYKEYHGNMVNFLLHTSGLSAKVGNPGIVGDCALVPVGLMSPQAPGGVFHAYQHLYWLNGSWRITESAGGLTQNPGKLTCPTGT